MQHYEEEFKLRIVRLHLEKGRTLKSLAEEYGVSKAIISIWARNYREGCQTNQDNKEEYDIMNENRRLRRELTEMQKENLFLKKAAAYFAKEID